MDFDLVLRSRHSVRVFSEKPVTRDILRKIVEDAGRAPSWVNAQEWHVYMATEKTLKNIRAEYMALAEKGDQGMADYGRPHREEWSKLAQEHMAGFHNLIASSTRRLWLSSRCRRALPAGRCSTSAVSPRRCSFPPSIRASAPSPRITS